MKTSINWLRKYVDIEEDVETLSDDLTMFGLNVEDIEGERPEYTGVVYGKVVEHGKHPQADRLSVCKVDVGRDELLNIVCGAPNVRKGLEVAVAVEGAVLKGGLKIKKTKLRGELSQGMICSETELGIGGDSSGIIELDLGLQPGEDLTGRLGEESVILDIEVTPNRPDQLCHLGVAREIAALYNRELRLPEMMSLEPGASFTVDIESPEDCPRFSAAFIDDVKVGPSPDWLRDLLASAGLKSINNIVDITNFVLMETGQPLHAYDRDTLGGDMIRVRRSEPKERIRTLDDTERELDGDILVIADESRPVGIAGVMGGGDTEVTEKTRRILLESAAFDRKAVRASSRSVKLDTDASYRFERECDPGATVEALERACWLIRECGAGTPKGIFKDVVARPEVTKAKEIFLRVKQANRIMGTHLAPDDLSELLERLQLPCKVEEDGVRVTVPTFRRDLKEEIDLIEETARVYGYENIGREEEVRGNIFSKVSVSDMRREDIRSYLAARGFSEAITSSFMDRDDISMMDWGASDQRSNPLPLSNPLSAQNSMMRSSLLPGLLRVIGRNSPSEQECIRVFELGKVFLPVDGIDSLPEEQMHLTAMFTRGNVPRQWIDPGQDTDYFVMKGELEGILERFPVGEEVQMVRSKEEQSSYIFDWLAKDRVLASSGMIPGKVSGAYDIDTPVFFFTIRVDQLDAVGSEGTAYEKPSPYPQVKRDLCVVAQERVTFADIRKVVEKRAKFLESIRLFDYYRGDKVGEGKRSYAFRLGFRSSEGTLDDASVDKVIEKILGSLERELQVTLRTEQEAGK